MGQYNAEWPISLIYVLKPLIIVIRAICKAWWDWNRTHQRQKLTKAKFEPCGAGWQCFPGLGLWVDNGNNTFLEVAGGIIMVWFKAKIKNKKFPVSVHIRLFKQGT